MFPVLLGLFYIGTVDDTRISIQVVSVFPICLLLGSFIRTRRDCGTLKYILTISSGVSCARFYQQ